MMPSLAALVLAVVAQSTPADSLVVRAASLPESSLLFEVRDRPMVAREAVVSALAWSTDVAAERQATLVAARRMADAFAVAWRDSFLVHQVERFARWTLAQRQAKVRADSLRRAGVALYAREGPEAAIATWQRASAMAIDLRDSAGLAATTDNIGAAWVAIGAHDSAAAYLALAKHLATAAGDLRVEANVVGHVADLDAARGNLAGARRGYAESQRLRARIGDTRGLAADLNNLGLIARELGDLADARRHFEAALAINRRERRDASAATNLVNLAGLSAMDGDLDRAATSYLDALATWRAREEWAEAAIALRGLGELEMRRGDYPAAQVFLSEAVEILDQTGPVDDDLVARRALADAHAGAGDLQGAIDQLATAESIADSALVGDGTRAGLAVAAADMAAGLNRFEHAEVLFQRAAQLYQRAGDVEGEAAARHGLANLALERGNPQRVDGLLAPALRALSAGGHRRALAIARQTMAEARWHLGDTVAARRLLDESARDLDGLDDPVASAAVAGARAGLEAAAGNWSRADSLYRSGLERMQGKAAPVVRWQLHAGLGQALRARGDQNAAARELRAAIRELERPARSLVVAERRAAFLADKWEVYAHLAMTEHERGYDGASFEASERMRAQETIERMSRGRVLPTAADGQDLLEREQVLRLQIAELTDQLDLTSPTADPNRSVDLSLGATPVRQALLRAQDEFADILVRLRERAPRRAIAVAPNIATWREAARRLRSDQALISYLVTDSGSMAFVITSDTMSVVDLGVGRRELVRLIEFVRGTLTVGNLDSSSGVPWRRLHALLIAPIEERRLLAGVTHLILAPHRELHYLPFAALVSARQPARVLGDRYMLTMTPSVSGWLQLGDRTPPRTGGGTLALAPSPDVLPATRREVESIGRQGGPGMRTEIGATATESLFRREAPGRRILHLAASGLLNKHNPLFSYVALAPGGGHDGRLEVHEVLGLTLAADLVVLSACQTALGSGLVSDVPSGDEWTGLTQAFLIAGAAQVVASLWPVDDWATAALMERFYAALDAGAGAAEALAQAQRDLREESSTARPYHWAGFVLVAGAEPLRARQP